MRFTLKDMFAGTVFIGMAACAVSWAARISQETQWSAMLILALVPLVLAVAIVGLLALFIGARERKALDDERRRNSQN